MDHISYFVKMSHFFLRTVLGRAVRHRRRHFCDAAAAGYKGLARRRRQYVGGATALAPLTVDASTACVLFFID